MYYLPILLVLVCAEPESGIVAPRTIAVGQTIIAYTNAPDDALCIWEYFYKNDDTFWIANHPFIDRRAAIFSSNQPGKYAFVLSITGGGKHDLFVHELIVGDDLPDPPDPPPPPPPPQPSNPYSRPAQGWLDKLKPLVDVRMEAGDAIKLADMYSDRAEDVLKKVRVTHSGRTETLALLPMLADLRQALIDYGKQLGLQGKYPGLADKMDSVLIDIFGLNNVKLNPERANEALLAIAWQIWECGHNTKTPLEQALIDVAPHIGWILKEPQHKLPDNASPLDREFVEKNKASLGIPSWVMLGCPCRNCRAYTAQLNLKGR